MACSALPAVLEEAQEQAEETTADTSADKGLEAAAAEEEEEDASSEAESATEAEQPVAELDLTKCVAEPFELPKNPGVTDVTSADWQHGGGDEARITLIEYGDFQ